MINFFTLEPIESFDEISATNDDDVLALFFADCTNDNIEYDMLSLSINND